MSNHLSSVFLLKCHTHREFYIIVVVHRCERQDDKVLNLPWMFPFSVVLPGAHSLYGPVPPQVSSRSMQSLHHSPHCAQQHRLRWWAPHAHAHSPMQCNHSDSLKGSGMRERDRALVCAPGNLAFLWLKIAPSDRWTHTPFGGLKTEEF